MTIIKSDLCAGRWQPDNGGMTFALRLIAAAAAVLLASCGGGSDADAGSRVLCQACGSSSGAPASIVAGFTQSGVGASVFDMPVRSARYAVAASYDGTSENFAVKVAGRLVINEVIGTAAEVPGLDGLYLFDGGVVEVLAGPGVKWSFVELR